MAISTKSIKKGLTAEERNKMVDKIKSYHKPAFLTLNVQASDFYPKTAFMWNDELHISLYERELTSEAFYTELVDSDYNPTDEDRQLYVFKGSKSCITEYYKKKETSANGEYERFFVPLHDFERVMDFKFVTPKSETPPIKTMSVDIEIQDEREDEEDALMSKLTIRDHAAIQWKLPVSKKEWLNKLIKKVNNV